MICSLIRELSFGPRQGIFPAKATLPEAAPPFAPEEIAMVEMPRQLDFQQSEPVAAAEIRAQAAFQRKPLITRGSVKRLGLAAALMLGAVGAWPLRLPILDHWPVPRLDRRRLREGRQHDRCAQGFGLHRRGAGRRQRDRNGWQGAGPHRRPRFPRRAFPGQSRCGGRGGRHPQPRRPDRAAALGHRPSQGHRRGDGSLADVRRTGCRSLPHAEQDRFRDRAACAADPLDPQPDAGSTATRQGGSRLRGSRGSPC